jgi:hypothetical protein
MIANQSQPRLWRGYLLAAGAALVFYLLSMAPSVLWQDSGLSQVRVLQRDLFGHYGLALSHPLYYLVPMAAGKGATLAVKSDPPGWLLAEPVCCNTGESGGG